MLSLSNFFFFSALVIGLMAADVASGVFRALSDGTFKSSVMRQGWWRKASEVSMLFGLMFADIIAVKADVDLAAPFGFIGGATYIAAMEVGSIVENLRSFGRKENED